MRSAMKGVTKALTAMNSKMDLPSLQRIMNDFLRENEKSELLQEASGDAIDDAMEEEVEDILQEEIIINQVIVETCIHLHHFIHFYLMLLRWIDDLYRLVQTFS
jgi:charged multivesicular body protein 2A